MVRRRATINLIKIGGANSAAKTTVLRLMSQYRDAKDPEVSIRAKQSHGRADGDKRKSCARSMA